MPHYSSEVLTVVTDKKIARGWSQMWRVSRADGATLGSSWGRVVVRCMAALAPHSFYQYELRLSLSNGKNRFLI